MLKISKIRVKDFYQNYEMKVFRKEGEKTSSENNIFKF